jgi:hypothetical protein
MVGFRNYHEPSLGYRAGSPQPSLCVSLFGQLLNTIVNGLADNELIRTTLEKTEQVKSGQREQRGQVENEDIALLFNVDRRTLHLAVDAHSRSPAASQLLPRPKTATP